jgi:hypothetical protein
MTDIVIQTLAELKDGIIVPSTHAKQIIAGTKTRILKSKLHRSHINKILYLIEGDLCYGLIRILGPEKVSVAELSQEDVHKWWPQKQVLFSYPFEVVTLYDSPKKVEITDRYSTTFVSSFNFVDDVRDFNNYDVAKLDNETLVNDWRYINAMHSSKKAGSNMSCSLDEINSVTEKIYHEILSRVADKKMEAPKSFMQLPKPESILSLEFSAAIPFDVHTIIADAAKEIFELSDKVVVEKKLRGERAFLVKNGSSTHLYSAGTGSIDNPLIGGHQEILDESSTLSSNNFVLDGVVSNSQFKAFDVVFLQKDLRNEPWEYRKSLLHSLNFTKHISEVSSIIVNNVEDAICAIRLFKVLPDSDGAVLKKCVGTYSDSSWLAYQASELSDGKFQPPESAKNNARQVLEWREKYGDEVKGMTSVGWIRANQLASGEQISLDIVKRMARFNRHRKNSAVAPEYKDTPWKDAGYVAWLGWGGDSGINWAIEISSKNNSDTTTSTPDISSVQGTEIDDKIISKNEVSRC